MKNRIYCTFILAIITVMVCAQTEQPKDSDDLTILLIHYKP